MRLECFRLNIALVPSLLLSLQCIILGICHHTIIGAEDSVKVRLCNNPESNGRTQEAKLYPESISARVSGPLREVASWPHGLIFNIAIFYEILADPFSERFFKSSIGIHSWKVTSESIYINAVQCQITRTCLDSIL